MKYLRFFSFLIVVFLSILSVSFSQFNYRTNASGNWDDASTWYYDNDGLRAASTPPPSDANSITIQSGHTVTIRSNLSITRTTIEGQVTVNSGVTLTVANEGGDPDLTLTSTGRLLVKGDLTVEGVAELWTGSTIIYNGSSAQTIAALDYYNLQIDNPAGVDLPIYIGEDSPRSSARERGKRSLAVVSNVTVEGTLTVTNGNVRTSSKANVLSSTQLTAQLAIAASAANGSRTVTVTDAAPGGGAASRANGLRIVNPLPTITSVAPVSGVSEQNITLAVSGSNFIAGQTTVNLGPGITTNSVTVNSTTQLTVSISLSPSAVGGPRTVTVSNLPPGGGSAALTNGFLVNNPAPTLTSLTASSGERGKSIGLYAYGTGFITGVTSISFGAGITVNSVSVSTPTQMYVSITVAADAAFASRDVIVTNPAPGGGTNTLNAGFSILSPAPTISGMTPPSVIRGQTTSVTMAGSNFFAGSTSMSLGTGITINSFAVNSSTQIVANISVGVDAPTGGRNVVVMNAPPGGGNATLTGGLTVENPAPTLASSSPILAARGDVLDVALTGTNFIPGVTTASFGDGIAVNSVTVSSLTRATANISIGIGAVLGLRNISVTNPAPGGGTSTLSSVFTVGNPVPTLTSVSPSAGKRGQTLTLTLAGTGFISGSTSVNLGANILVNSLVVSTATQITANVTIGIDAAPGARGASVTNVAPGGGTATVAGGLTVENPLPILSSIAPVSGVRGTTLSVTLTGSNFINGLSQVSLGPDLQVNSVSVSSSTQIVVGIAIAQGASTGSRDVLVTHAAPGGGTATLSSAFSVTNPAPSLASVAPVSAGRRSVLNVTVTGSQFISGVTSVSFGSDITVSNLLVKSLTELQASITISSSATVGPRSVTITNAAPGGGSASLPNGFSVTTNPATEVEADPGALPKEYVLQEAYPNPFNPSTRIAYSLPEESRLRLEVHNMLGNVVAELAIGERARGSYELQWHADNLPSGVYLIRMHAESLESTKRFIASRKVVLVK